MTAPIQAYTESQVCELLGVSRWTLQRLRRRREIRATRVGAGRNLRYLESEVRRYLERRTR